MWPKWNQVEFIPGWLDFVIQTLMDLKKHFNRVVSKIFWARLKYELGEHLVTQASNNVMKKYWLRGWFLAASC